MCCRTGMSLVLMEWNNYFMIMEMKRKRNIKSIVLLAALGIATLFFINISFASTNAKVNVETANLRESADENSKILEQLSQGQEVEIVEKSSDWYKVKVKGMTGYLRQDLLTVEEKDTVNANTTTSSEEKAEVETTKNEETKTTDTDEKSKIIVEDTKLKIVPSINATDIIEKNSGIKILDGELTSDSYGMIVKKGNTELLETVNKVLNRLSSDGSIDNFIIKHTEE